MQGIVFIYEESRSVKNSALTVRIEERRKKGNTWMPVGSQKVYTARDLQHPGLKLLDKTLFSMAFKSETDFRQMEAHFFSPDQEYTLFRISPYDLKAFLDRCNTRGLLCQKDGRLIRFQYLKNTVPDIVFKNSSDGFYAFLSLDGHKVPAPCYATASDPVRIVSGNQVYELAKGLPATVIKDLIRGKTIPYDEFDRILEKWKRSWRPGFADSPGLIFPGD